MTILPPELSFNELVDQLEALGWKEIPTPGLLPPLIAGEPESAHFDLAGKTLFYSFNPAIRLRLLEGPVPNTLPVVDDATVHSWKESEDEETSLRGIQAESALATSNKTLPIENALPVSSVDFSGLLDQSLAQLRQTPDTLGADTFAQLPSDLQKSVLRQLMQVKADSTGELLPIAFKGDAELSAIAIVATARLMKVDLGLAVRRADLSPLFSNRHMREFCQALKKATLATLQGERPKPASDAPKDKFWLALLGQGDNSWGSMVIDSLIRPRPDRLIAPAIGFASVPAVPHWLGSDPRSISRWTPPSNYALSIEVKHQLANVTEVNPEELCSAQEWEAALRGPTGLPFPWGMLPFAPANALSPWGCQVGRGPEWCRQGDQLVWCELSEKHGFTPPRKPQSGGFAAVRTRLSHTQP